MKPEPPFLLMRMTIDLILEPLSGIVQISSGAEHTCALNGNGNVFCWGKGTNGRLGNQPMEIEDPDATDGSTIANPLYEGDQNYPVSVLAEYVEPPPIEEEEEEEVPEDDGETPGAGGSEDDDSGVPKQDVPCDPNVDTDCEPTTPDDEPVDEPEPEPEPEPVALLSGIRQVSAGDSHTCALHRDRRVLCWGHGVDGRLGDGETDDNDIPYAVIGAELLGDPPAPEPEEEEEEEDDSEDDSQDDNGGLAEGDDDDDDVDAPVDVVLEPDAFLTGISQISAGSAHTCVVNDLGRVLCWGSGANGRLGDDRTNASSPRPVYVLNAAREDDQLDLNTDEVLDGVKRVSAGDVHNCAQLSEGGFLCWGDPSDGRLGDGGASAGGSIPVSVNEGATVPLVAPGNFTLTEPLEGSAVDIVWDPVLVEDNGGSQITHYEYRFKAEGDEEYGPWTAIPDSAEGGSHNALYQIVSLPSTTPPAPLTNGINHLFELRVVNGIGASDPSTEIEGFPATTPTEPVDVAVDADRDESAKVTWGAPDDDGGKPITSYQVQVTHIDDSNSVEIDEDWFTTPSPDYHEFSNLQNGIDYTFNVRAVNDVGEGDLGSSNGVPATRPDAPFLSVVSEDDQAVTVKWSAPENDGGRDIDEYELRTNRTGQWVAPSDAADNQHTFTGLTNGLPYTFEVRAINELGEGKPDSISAIPVTVPGAPIGVAANRGNRALHISWGEPSTNGGGDVTGYELSYGEINQYR